MSNALALLEYSSVAVGTLAVDRMLKRSPVSLLRCGTVHPGRYLALVGGTVAAVEEAHAAGVATGNDNSALMDEVCLADPHAALSAAVGGERSAPVGETVGVLEVSTSPGLLRALDALLKAVPVHLAELRLADDLGGRAIAVIDGDLPDVQEAAGMAGLGTGACGELLQAAILSNVDETLREILGEGTRFGGCREWPVAGAETERR